LKLFKSSRRKNELLIVAIIWDEGWIVGEMPIELGVSWLSAKAIKVVRSINYLDGKALKFFQKEV